jgi:hypothetical protein
MFSVMGSSLQRDSMPIGATTVAWHGGDPWSKGEGTQGIHILRDPAFSSSR